MISEFWFREDAESIGRITDHIRRRGYIDQETLGDLHPTYGRGDCVWPDGSSIFARDYTRITEAAKLRRQGPSKPKYEPDF